jgi:DNA-directed RNA polymerase beta subunit
MSSQDNASKHQELDSGRPNEMKRGNMCFSHSQPVYGRSIDGGLRMGEMEQISARVVEGGMERDTLIAPGFSRELLERLTLVSASHLVIECQKCGSLAILNIGTQTYICSFC